MKHNHTHDHCKHETIKFCPPCNVTYCKDCGQEWGRNYNWTYTTPHPYTTGTGTIGPYLGGGGGGTICLNDNICHDGHEVKV